LRDYDHASKTFRTNAYGNAPKLKWLFHVYFDINKTMVTNNPSAFPADPLPGILVKNITLPKFSMTLAEMNQYNRKRYVQTKIGYDPVQITLHDDNNGAVKKMWYNYFSYYYNDPTNPINQDAINQLSGGDVSLLNTKNTYSPALNPSLKNWGLKGEPANTSTSNSMGVTKAPFFKSIRIYGFNQHSFSLYTLINPIIESFQHDTYDYSQGTGVMENRMTLRYETVKYSDGALNGQSPGSVVTGFASDGLYDRRLSPIAKPGSNRTILGQGGLVDAGVGVLEDLQNGNLIGAIQKGGTLSRTFKNPQNILQTAKSELLYGVLNATNNPQTSRGLFNFPAQGAGSGTGAQRGSSFNFPNIFAPNLPTNDNAPIQGGDQGQFL
jgi:hypothetical protein